MIETIILFLFFLIIIGVRITMIADDIKAAQARIAAALAAIAAQQGNTISAADAAAILANEQTNAVAAEALVIP